MKDPAAQVPPPPRKHARPMTQAQVMRKLFQVLAKPPAADSTPVVELERGARGQILIRVRTTGRSTRDELEHASSLAQGELDRLMARYPDAAAGNGGEGA